MFISPVHPFRIRFFLKKKQCNGQHFHLQQKICLRAIKQKTINKKILQSFHHDGSLENASTNLSA